MSDTSRVEVVLAQWLDEFSRGRPFNREIDTSLTVPFFVGVDESGHAYFGGCDSIRAEEGGSSSSTNRDGYQPSSNDGSRLGPTDHLEGPIPIWGLSTDV